MAATDWLGNAPGTEPAGRFRIRWPADRIREQQLGKTKGRAGWMPKLSKDQMAALAEEEEALIPIRLDIEHGELKLRDVLTWNLRDPQMTPDVFAVLLCEDLQLPENPFRREIVASISEQLEEARKSSYADNVYSRPSPPDEDPALFWKRWRETGGQIFEPFSAPDPSMSIDHEELRILIRVRRARRSDRG